MPSYFLSSYPRDDQVKSHSKILQYRVQYAGKSRGKGYQNEPSPEEESAHWWIQGKQGMCQQLLEFLGTIKPFSEMRSMQQVCTVRQFWHHSL